MTKRQRREKKQARMSDNHKVKVWREIHRTPGALRGIWGLDVAH